MTKDAENSENNKLSVIIRARNEERWIGHTIQSILDFVSYPEIIVINNQSSDRTVEIAKHFQSDPELVTNRAYTEIRIVDIEGYTPGKAINYGAELASHEYVLLISGHCVLREFQFDRHVKDLEDYVAIFGNQIPIWEGKKIKKRYLWNHFGEEKVVNLYSEMEGRYFLHNAACLYKKQTISDYPFDKNLTGKEDRYWANKMIEDGKNILYDPSIIVEHHYTENGNTWKGIG